MAADPKTRNADQDPDAKANDTAATKGNARRTKARQNAQDMLGRCEDKLRRLKADLGATASDQLDTVFEHGKEMLADDWEPKHLIRDSVAVSLNAVDALHRIYEAAYTFLKPRS
jgi:hypothetical protein